MSNAAPPGDLAHRSVAWSAAYLVVTRVSALVAVPILLHALGTDLYAVWVVASSLVFAQGLVDLGFSAALVRFVAVGAAEGSARAVRLVIRRVALVYLGLSLLGVLLWFSADTLARALPYVADGEVDDAVLLVRYTAVAFVLTNATTLISAALQGLDRVASAYRAQTIGSAAFVPILVVGLQTMSGVHAVGLAAVGSYTLQLLLLAPALWTTIGRLAHNPAEMPTLRAMLAIGMQWQVSSWADFATFQLPRIAAGISLSSGAVLVVDLALRFGQAVTMPLFAVLPIVLPRAAAAWARGGRDGVREVLGPLLRVGAPLCLLLAAVAVPIAAPALETWTGHGLSLGDSIAASCVAAAVLAHASTGVLSSVLLAIGEVGAVVRYKSIQLALAAPLVAIGAAVGQIPLAVGLSVALVAPALWFNRGALRALAVDLGVPRLLSLGALAVFAGCTVAVVLATPVAAAAIVLLLTCAGGVLASFFVLRYVDPGLIRELSQWRPARAPSELDQTAARLR